LNTISSLIYRDLQKAERFIRDLAAVYRKVLDSYEYQLVSLEEELKLVEHYSSLMQVRFEDAFYFNIELPEETNLSCVPPLSVQMLVENAIKHNHMSQENPLKVNITSSHDGYLVVSNNFIGDPGHVKIGNDLYRKPGPSRSTGIGLQNIKNRYRMISNKPVLITKDDSFTVSLPLIPAHEE
jgi:LytS/YehU family sensor histidine kinase